MNMNQVIMFNNKTVGRDSLARLIQYASKFTWYILQQCSVTGSSVNKMKDLEYILSNFRRLLRMGRCIDTLYTAMCLINHEDALVSFNCAVSKVSYSLFLLCDHIIWFGRNGFTNVNINRWNRIACRYWLLSIVIKLVRDYVEIRRVLRNCKLILKFNDRNLLTKNIITFTEAHKDILLDILKNTCDIFLPLAALNYINLSPGAIGFLGIISSMAGVYTIWDPFAKLPLS